MIDSSGNTVRTALAVLMIALMAASVRAADRPNILLIMADDMGYEVPAYTGGTSYDTPNLDALAASGMQFTHAYSNPKCVPSRVNILTGRYGFRTGQQWGYIPPGEITFANVLQGAGYATALSGKWQLGLLKDHPLQIHDFGFDTYAAWAWHEGPRYWNPLIWRNGTLVDEEIEDHYGPEVFTDFLIDFMEINRDRPFLAYYPMCLPHFAKTGGEYKEPVGPNGRYQTYKQLVERTDAMVGKLLQALDRLGLRENTLVVFTADNGTPNRVTSQFRGRAVEGGKSMLTDAGTHVPFIASWPRVTPGGATCDDLVDFSDILPTLADLADTDLPGNVRIDGRSFAPQLKGNEGNPRKWVYTEFEGKAWIRTHRWKLYDSGKFYDLETDPRETRPLKRSQLPEEAQEARAFLAAEFHALRASQPDRPR